MRATFGRPTARLARSYAAKARARTPDKPARDGSSAHPPNDIVRADRDAGPIDRECRGSLGESRSTILVGWFLAHANDRATRSHPPTNNAATIICKTIRDFAPNVDRSNSPPGLLASAGLLFAAEPIRRTSFHLPKA